MAATLGMGRQPAGNDCNIEAEIELTRLKILYALGHESWNYRMLRFALYRYAWLLLIRRYGCCQPGMNAVQAFETVEHFLTRILPDFSALSSGLENIGGEMSN
jgi:hypothetical protein